MNKQIVLMTAVLICAGCCGSGFERTPLIGPLLCPPEAPPVVTGDLQTDEQQSAIAESADAIGESAGVIKNESAGVRARHPDDPAPPVLDGTAERLRIEAAKLRQQVAALGEKQDAADKRLQANASRIHDLEAQLKEAQDEMGWIYTVLYAAMIGIGVVVLAAAGFIMWVSQGQQWRMAIGVAIGGGTFVIMGVTLPQYGVYIGWFGLVFVIGGMVAAGLYIRNKLTEDEQTQHQLVRDVQTALEHDPITALDIMSRQNTDQHKQKVKELKKANRLGPPKIAADRLQKPVAAPPAADPPTST